MLRQHSSNSPDTVLGRKTVDLSVYEVQPTAPKAARSYHISIVNEEDEGP
jgi:hypothetical protein